MSKFDKNEFLEELEIDYKIQVEKKSVRINKRVFLIKMFKYLGINTFILQFSVMCCLLTVFVMSYYTKENYLITNNFIKWICSSVVITVVSGFFFLGNSYRYEMIELESTTIFSKKDILKVQLLISFFTNVVMLSLQFILFSYVNLISFEKTLFYFIFSIEISFLGLMLLFQKLQEYPIDWYLYLVSLTVCLIVLILTIPNVLLEALYINISPIYLLTIFTVCIYTCRRILKTD